MAELVVIGPEAADLMSDDPGVSMRFYCWPCRTVHAFTLAEVERIVYALGAMVVDSYSLAADDPELAAEASAGLTDCLKIVLRDSADGDMYAEHVEQGVECRERADG